MSTEVDALCDRLNGDFLMAIDFLSRTGKRTHELWAVSQIGTALVTKFVSLRSILTHDELCRAWCEALGHTFYSARVIHSMPLGTTDEKSE